MDDLCILCVMDMGNASRIRLQGRQTCSLPAHAHRRALAQAELGTVFRAHEAGEDTADSRDVRSLPARLQWVLRPAHGMVGMPATSRARRLRGQQSSTASGRGGASCGLLSLISRWGRRGRVFRDQAVGARMKRHLAHGDTRDLYGDALGRRDPVVDDLSPSDIRGPGGGGHPPSACPGCGETSVAGVGSRPRHIARREDRRRAAPREVDALRHLRLCAEPGVVQRVSAGTSR